MRGREELIRRLSLKRRRKLGSLSDEAYQELELAVKQDPFKFVDDNEEEAFALVVQALERFEASHHDNDLLDDEQYALERQKQHESLAAACQQAVQVDPRCVDAILLLALAPDDPQDEILQKLTETNEEFLREQGGIPTPPAGDAWADVFARPRLRMLAALARTSINTACFRLATDYCSELLAKAPLDALGARFTYALACARLEDEDRFMWLDAREGGHGNAWFHLSRAILMYKLGRTQAARRALRGYDRLCTGGAYLLLQPLFVDTYLPDRPEFEPGSFVETMLCAHEADPIVSDIPDFPAWACNQPGFLASAQDFCERNGFEWRNWDE